MAIRNENPSDGGGFFISRCYERTLIVLAPRYGDMATTQARRCALAETVALASKAQPFDWKHNAASLAPRNRGAAEGFEFDVSLE
jgi:hypothetical protein